MLYASGEESARQIKMRAQRLGSEGEPFPEHLYLVTETNLDAILAHVEQVKPALLVVDSHPNRLPGRLILQRRIGVPGARMRFTPA